MSFLSRVATRGYATRANNFAGRAARVSQKDFGWQKLVTPFTNPGFIARMKELDTKFQAMRTEINSVPSELQTIDWAYYEKNIKDKALVAQLRREYENMTFPKIEGEDLSAINASIDQAIARASTAVEISTAEIPKLEAQLAACKEDKAQAVNWQLEDWYKRIPGLETQFQKEYEEGWFLPSEAEERLEAQDLTEARKAFRTNQPIPVPDDVSTTVGSFNLESEMAEATKTLDKMFGGIPSYEEAKAKRAAAAAAKKPAHH